MPESTNRVRIAYLSYSSGEFDARTFRMARSAIDAGCDVVVYSRWHPGQAPTEERDGFRLIRVPFDWRLAIPGLRRGAARRARAAMAEAARVAEASPATEASEAEVERLGVRRMAARLILRILRRTFRWSRGVRVLLIMFPLGPLGWARALDEVVEPADIWHGMWAGSLPALVRLRRRHGGKAIYDSRDLYMESREWARIRWPVRPILQFLERHWAGAVDQVLTVNASYAGILQRLLRIPRPSVVLNCPPRWDVPDPPPDLIRRALGLPSEVAIALYQGRLMSDRGIEQCMAAILDVPEAVLVLLGFGKWESRLRTQISEPPYAGRVFLLPAVAPDELLEWTASADVTVMAIQPTSLNHEWTTPQKLFESLTAGVPVVAADLPGMAEIVRASMTGVLVDPTIPSAIASGIREVLDATPAKKAALRVRIRKAAAETYNWENQLETLFGTYRGLLPESRAVPPGLEGPPWGQRRDHPAGPRLRFVGRPEAGHEGITTVILDPAWIGSDTDRLAGLVAARDVIDGILSARDLGAEAFDQLEDWAEASEIASIARLDGTSFWYGMRLRYWTWLLERMLWLGVVDSLIASNPGAALECTPGTDPALQDACRFLAGRHGLSMDPPPSRRPRPSPDRATTTTSQPNRSKPPRTLIGRLRWKFFPPEDERRMRVIEHRLERAQRAGPGALLVVEAHASQRIETPAGPRLMNAYLGPIVERLAGTNLAPVEVDIRAEVSRNGDWDRVSGPGSGGILSADVMQMVETGTFDRGAARAEAARIASRIEADDSALIVQGTDLGPALRASLVERVIATFPRRRREISQIRALLQRLRPAGILLADEYHRPEWLAAAALENIRVAAVQHGVIHRWHLGYVHRSRPSELRLADRTYVFGSWEKALLVEHSVYRADEVMVGGSPRLDLVHAAAAVAPNLRTQLGVSDDRKMVVLSGTWGDFHRRHYYPIALRRLFDRSLRGIHIVIKLHPSEPDAGPYRAVIENVARAGGFEPPPMTAIQLVDLYALLEAADAHLGIRSTVLTEAVVVGTPNLLATGLAGADPLGYLGAGVAVAVPDGAELQSAVDAWAGRRIPDAAARAFVDAHFDPNGGARVIADDLLKWLA